MKERHVLMQDHFDAFWRRSLHQIKQLAEVQITTGCDPIQSPGLEEPKQAEWVRNIQSEVASAGGLARE